MVKMKKPPVQALSMKKVAALLARQSWSKKGRRSRKLGVRRAPNADRRASIKKRSYK